MSNLAALTFENFMHKGHEALQANYNNDAVLAFDDAKVLAVTHDQQSEALQMQGVAYLKQGRLILATVAFDDALFFATLPYQKGKVLRDQGMLQLQQAEMSYDSEYRAHMFDVAEATLNQSYTLLSSNHDYKTESAATLGFLGRAAYLRGDHQKAKELLRHALRDLSANPVYKFNNLVWLMLASPSDRWRQLPEGVRLISKHKANRSTSALVKLLSTLGGWRTYEFLRKKSVR